jgi:hypothetical protein
MSENCFEEINEQTKINVPKKQYPIIDMSKISTYGSFQEDVLSKIHVCRYDAKQHYCHDDCTNNCLKQKYYFECFHAYVRRPEVMYLELSDYHEIVETSESKMKSRYRSNIVFMNRYLYDPNKKTYQSIDYRPFNKDKDVVKPDVFNLFRGFFIQKNYVKYSEEKKIEATKRLLDLIYALFGKEQGKNLINYIASIIQLNHKSKNGMFVFVPGKQGTGKGHFIINFIKSLVGENNYFYTAKARRRCGK